jgi:hypothetical protein
VSGPCKGHQADLGVSQPVIWHTRPARRFFYPQSSSHPVSQSVLADLMHGPWRNACWRCPHCPKGDVRLIWTTLPCQPSFSRFHLWHVLIFVDKGGHALLSPPDDALLGTYLIERRPDSPSYAVKSSRFAYLDYPLWLQKKSIVCCLLVWNRL